MTDTVKPDVADAVRVFEEHRGRLRAVAYRVLGSFSDAEDVVQDAWLRWNGVEIATVDDPEAYLVRITTRLAIDRLRSAQSRRESYVGPWLPEPVLTSPDVAEDVVLSDSVSTALLLVLETLSPIERAVFVLREAFGYPYGTIGEIVGRSEATARQTARHAREHVEARRTRYDTDLATRSAVTERFLAASAGGDLAKLIEVLAPDVSLVSDGGGLAPAPRKAIHGVDLVARALVTFAGRMPEEANIHLVMLNGGPGIVVRSGLAPVAAISLHLVDGAVRTIHLVSNPEKLAGLRDL
ncbi:RNA polymerase sigma factor SigJ [Frankia sp. CNm7]|uniref:RNA polymerase sigma factor SigJ n=1 Tax=Frankia nepalensis TaxID=1836974 RepID=A0A937RCT2_9ACTN|nr:RNA polymerase sigma factor SigJ [Frankia nepalensis]MBL7498421.1 RNA polymerase sigma factor SigJ [Frankia nepalensis]MBL7509965.1 RNA polymerase sigma factor SigJ [Frankia nepalensis]MBL7520183.1 RNA polymerase sigma factor SigJ [Frankia nepalensis]MBL7629751.1 RNA polymerase sigma factor SigJ [Frankia nepalensis]